PEGLEELLRLWVSTPSLPRHQLVRSWSSHAASETTQPTALPTAGRGRASMSKSSGLGWWTCEGWQPCNCLRILKARCFQESRMPGNPLVRFDEGRVGR